MAIMLTDLANWLREGGCTVREYSGWQYRVRGGGPYTAMPLAVVWHHTASSTSWNGQKDADYIATGDPNSPLANLYIDRQGTVWVLAAGPTNTNGKGGPMTFSRGTVPLDGMNSRAVGIECGNTGVGERWPVAQIDALFRASNIVNAKCGNQPTDISGHHQWAPTRKIDPATNNVEGNWIPRSINANGTWNLDDMRNECVNRSTQPNGDDMAYPCEGLWQFEGAAEVYAVYNVGYKTWLPDPPSLAAKQALLRINGVNDQIQMQKDRAMFMAFGQVLGPRPEHVDEWGLPK